MTCGGQIVLRDRLPLSFRETLSGYGKEKEMEKGCTDLDGFIHNTAFDEILARYYK
jgi:hypothetical protein